VTDVEQAGGVLRELALSLFTKPEYEGVMVGAALPYVVAADEAVTINGARPMVVSPPT
jgi:hypothetical protein